MRDSQPSIQIHGPAVRALGAMLGMCIALLGLGAVAALGSPLAAVAHAAGGTPQFSLQPVALTPSNPATASYFVFAAQPGAIVHGQVRLTNTGTAAGAAALYSVDATTGQTSGAVYLARQAPRTDVGAWITVSTAQVTLNPGQSRVISFTVTVPAKVRPGQHLGGLVAENLSVQQSTNSGSVQINVQHLSIVAVQVNLPGNLVELLSAQSVGVGGEHGYQMLDVGLTNGGTQMLKPYGTLQINNQPRQQVKMLTMKLDTFLPQTSISYPVLVTGQGLGVGRYTAILTLYYGTNQVLRFTTAFTISAANVRQVFGGAAPTSPPPSNTSSGASGSVPTVALVAGVTLAVLVFLASTVFAVPGLRTRVRLPWRKS